MESNYGYLVSAAMIWVLIPVLIVYAGNFFAVDYSETTPLTYSEILADFDSYGNDGGFIKSWFFQAWGLVVDVVDFLIGWAAEPIFDAASNFIYNVNILTDSMGIPSYIVYAFFFVYSLPVIALLVYLFIEFLKAIGGFIPFT